MPLYPGPSFYSHRCLSELLTAAAEAKTERHGNDLSDDAGDADSGSESSTKKS
jgi:hypothetical protein